MSSQWYVKENSLYRITEVTKKALNSFDQERLDRPVSPTYPAIVPPSSSCHPGSSIVIDGNFEGPLTERQAHHGTGMKFTGRRCTFIFSTIACTDC